MNFAATAVQQKTPHPVGFLERKAKELLNLGTTLKVDAFERAWDKALKVETDGKRFFKEGSRQVFFEMDPKKKGQLISYAKPSNNLAQSMVDQALAGVPEGKTPTLKITMGDQRFRRAVWMYGSRLGISVEGYEPTAEDRAVLKGLRERHKGLEVTYADAAPQSGKTQDAGTRAQETPPGKQGASPNRADDLSKPTYQRQGVELSEKPEPTNKGVEFDGPHTEIQQNGYSYYKENPVHDVYFNELKSVEIPRDLNVENPLKAHIPDVDYSNWLIANQSEHGIRFEVMDQALPDVVKLDMAYTEYAMKKGLHGDVTEAIYQASGEIRFANDKTLINNIARLEAFVEPWVSDNYRKYLEMQGNDAFKQRVLEVDRLRVEGVKELKDADLFKSVINKDPEFATDFSGLANQTHLDPSNGFPDMTKYEYKMVARFEVKELLRRATERPNMLLVSLVNAEQIQGPLNEKVLQKASIEAANFIDDKLKTRAGHLREHVMETWDPSLTDEIPFPLKDREAGQNFLEFAGASHKYPEQVEAMIPTLSTLAENMSPEARDVVHKVLKHQGVENPEILELVGNSKSLESVREAATIGFEVPPKVEQNPMAPNATQTDPRFDALLEGDIFERAEDSVLVPNKAGPDITHIQVDGKEKMENALGLSRSEQNPADAVQRFGHGKEVPVPKGPNVKKGIGMEV